MSLVRSVSGLFEWRQFEPEVILLAVGWYLRFSLSYRDVEELLAERGVAVDHVTLWRWVQRYVPGFEKRWSRYARPVGDSWRVDETYLKTKGQFRHWTAQTLTSASSSGSTTVKVLPFPTSLSTPMVPPCNSTIFRVNVKPSPVPS